MLCFVYICACLSVGSPEVPLPWLIAWSQLWTSTTITAIITIIIIITNIPATLQLSGILSQLQLEISRKLNELPMLLNSGLNFEKKKLLEQVLGCKNTKEREQEWKRTHHPCVIGKRVAYNIFIATNRTLLSKAIRVVGINQPRHKEDQ